MPLALVTGASRGIGRAIAAEFCAQSWKVLTPTRSELDLGDSNAIRHWCAQSGTEKIDALVHSAGINQPRPFSEIPDKLWAETLQINLTALRQLLQGLAPRTDGARILAIGSILGIISRPDRAAYSASKAALGGLIRSFAVELGPRGILANVLCPGYVDTDLTRQNNTPEQIASIEDSIPLRRLARPEEIARLAVWLCSLQNTYLTGQSIICDGGFTCL